MAEKAVRPSFPLYPGDWKKNADLRRCTEAARGAFVDIMCALHGSPEYGVRRWTLRELARSADVRWPLAKELADKGVLSGADEGAGMFVFTPTHAGRAGMSVILVDAKGGPVWYYKQFVLEEHYRSVRGNASRFGGTPKVSPTEPPKGGIGDDIGTQFGGGFGDGPSVSSSSSIGTNNTSYPPNTSEARAEPDPDNPLPMHVQCAQAMIAAGVTPHTNTGPNDPRLIELVKLGATPPLLAAAVRLGAIKKPPVEPHSLFNFAISVVRRQLAEAAVANTAPGAPNGHAGPKPSASDAVAAANAAAAERSTRERKPGAAGGVSCFDPDEDGRGYVDPAP